MKCLPWRRCVLSINSVVKPITILALLATRSAPCTLLGLVVYSSMLCIDRWLLLFLLLLLFELGPRVKLWSSCVVRVRNGYLDSWYISVKNLEL